MPKVFLPEMTFAEVEDVLDQVELAVIPTGSNEGHGPHLPLQVDAATSTHVACKAAERLYPRALVTPTLRNPTLITFPFRSPDSRGISHPKGKVIYLRFLSVGHSPNWRSRERRTICGISSRMCRWIEFSGLMVTV